MSPIETHVPAKYTLKEKNCISPLYLSSVFLTSDFCLPSSWAAENAEKWDFRVLWTKLQVLKEPFFIFLSFFYNFETKYNVKARISAKEVGSGNPDPDNLQQNPDSDPDTRDKELKVLGFRVGIDIQTFNRLESGWVLKLSITRKRNRDWTNSNPRDRDPVCKPLVMIFGIITYLWNGLS